MNAPYYNGDDDRDTLNAAPEPDCPICGVDADTACLPSCTCVYCESARARLKAAEHFMEEFTK